MSPAIDVHAHVLIPEAMRVVAGHPGFRAQQEAEARRTGAVSTAVNRERMGPPDLRTTDPDQRLADMDAAGVDIQLVSPLPAYHPWTDAELATRAAQLLSDGVAEHCAKAPDRLYGLSIAPVHHVDVAVEQLRYAMSVGLKGVEIPSQAGDRDLSAPSLDPFWAEAERLGAIVFLHPLGCSIEDRLNEWYMYNIVGHPLEHAIALSHLIFSGVLDRFPSLKILAAHGGGYLPVHIGRADHGWHVRPDAHSCDEPPSSYLRRMWFDSLVHSPRALRALIEAAGADRVVLGSDYPFDMGTEDPVGDLAAAELPAATTDAIRGANASGLLDL